jgi:hypothetical protein
MTRLFILSTVAVASLSLAACGANDTDTAYIGSRDDIIVNNRNMPTQPAPEKIETVKMDAEEMAASEAEKQRIAAQEAAIAAANEKMAKAEDEMEKVTATSADEIKTMKTTPMGIVDTTPKAQTVAATEPAAASAAASEAVIPASMQGDVPPNARPGECYAKVLIPAVKETHKKRVQVSEERKVLARIVPAKYEIKTERVMVTPARKYWKAGHGPITRKDEVTGEIMCLVEEPATYKTIEKRVLIEPEKPEYKTVPAQFETVTSSKVIQPESWEWRRILCETNMGPNSIARIQQALNAKGYDIKVDGKLGNQTLGALNDYNRKNGLPTRGITYETLDHLGVRLIGA